MEELYFNEIRDQLCKKHTQVSKGKMMSSEAIIYKGKVFAFFSRKRTMVFKLGKEFDTTQQTAELNVFNPFKKRAPLYGWYEATFNDKAQWPFLTEQALDLIKQNNP